jgi:hypothetical protein
MSVYKRIVLQIVLKIGYRVGFANVGLNLVIVVGSLLSASCARAQQSNASVALSGILCVVPDTLQRNPISRQAIEDAVALLRQGFPATPIAVKESYNPLIDSAAVVWHLPDLADSFEVRTYLDTTGWPPRPAKPYPTTPTPDTRYAWRSLSKQVAHATGTTQAPDRQVVVLTLSTYTPEGVANALYGLLQELLDFHFIHPRQTLIPNHRVWPLNAEFEWVAAPRFEQRGFHLHTEHPLELTEQLHDSNHPTGYNDLKEYFIWLARNQQNLFQFYLLRTIDEPRWGPYMAKIVDYAHSRGIRCGLKLSLHSIQQRAYQLVSRKKPSLRRAQRDIDARLKALFAADWDFVSPDLSIAEFLEGVGKNSRPIEKYLFEQLTQKYNARMMYNTHVIQPQNVGVTNKKTTNTAKRSKAEANPHLPDLNDPALRAAGVEIHSVMNYSVTEPKAPVYGNENLRFMLEKATQEVAQRETWYFPESAYWITFDNSLPLSLMTYLEARLDDIKTMEQLGASGHLTFSSGWEWGYWTIDWSIARWAWVHTFDGQRQANHPLQYLGSLLPDTAIIWYLDNALNVEGAFLKDLELMRYMAANQPMDELPKRYRKPYQPSPRMSYKDLWRKADKTQITQTYKHGVEPLREYATLTRRWADSTALMLASPMVPEQVRPLFAEWVTGLQVNALRALHRAQTLAYLLECRRRKVDKRRAVNKTALATLLDTARNYRLQAQKLIGIQSKRYRYPVKDLAARRPSFTAYYHGYLYSAHTLHFWLREEEQVRRKRFGVLFMNFWHFGRIVGIWPWK